MSLATVTYSYDALGRPSGKTVTDANGSTLVDEDFDLDIHGWTNSIIAKDNVNRTFFRENLAYTNPPTPISVARYDGNISESSYFHFSYPDDTPAILNSFYSYSYDGMKRLVDAKHSNVSVFDNDLDTERHITYDRNGNITSLIRYSSDGGGEPLSFSHTGNRMTSVNGNSYSYDSAGNMTHDGRKGLDISYNCLNLPSYAETADGSSLTYTYLADGTKMLVTNSGRGFRYKGSFTFSVAGANNFALESIACDEGRFALVSGGTSSPASLKDLFFVTDHLGNVRSIADVSPGLTAPVILEQNDYLPFGTKVQNSSYASITENRYRYAGKEEQNIGGINLSLLDFGARYYDPYVARWTSVDPMAKKYLGIMPYNYCGNNPINIIDPTGSDWYTDDSGNYTWIAGHDKYEGLTNIGDRFEKDGKYYSMFGAVVSNSEKYPMADIYKAIDELVTRYIHAVDYVPSNSMDQESPNTITYFSFPELDNPISFYYRGKNFTSIKDGTLLFPSKETTFRNMKIKSGHYIQVSSFPDGGPMTYGGYNKTSNTYKQWPNSYWIIGVSLEKRSNPLQIRFDRKNAEAFLDDINKQLR